jgi:hypothetical protein
MTLQANHLVSKVHPLAREVEPEDPMELVATPVEGEPDFMLQCIVEEFTWMGMDAEQLLGLFRNPEYPVLNQLLRHYGAEAIQQRVRALQGPLGGIRFREVIEEPEPGEDEGPELIQLSVGRITDDRRAARS